MKAIGGKKRKLAPKSSQPGEPPLKQHQSEPEPENLPEEYEEVEEYEEIEVDDDQEEEKEVEEEEEEEDQGNREEPAHGGEENEDDEPIQKLLEPFTKEYKEEGLPLEGFDYDSILGQCCEMPIGFVQIPVGVAGPLLLDGCRVHRTNGYNRRLSCGEYK